MRTKHETIDIYSLDGKDIHTMLQANNKGLIMFTENEYGCASHIAIGGLIDLNKPDAKILTHLINNNVFNQTEDYEDIGWDMYFDNGYTVVNITRWPQTSLMPPEHSMNTWIHIYPPVRDLVELAHKNGHKNLTYVSTTTIHDALDNDVFKLHKPTEIMQYDFHQTISDDTNLFFSPPTWLFPHMGKLMGYETCTAIVSGHNADERLDWEAGMALQDRLLSMFDLPLIEGASLDIKHELELLFDRTDEMVGKIEGLVNKQASAPNHMWG